MSIETPVDREGISQGLLHHSPFTEEEDEFRELVRTFLDREIEPIYQGLATDSESRHKVWKQAGEAGILGATVPETYDGLGMSPIVNMILSQEMARSHCYGTVGSLFCTDLATGILLDGGSPELIREWAPKIMAGEAIQAMAATEPEAGSDLLAMRTTATPDGDDFIISGEKTFITNGDIADIVYVVAKTDPAARGKSMTMFLVDPNAPGVTRGKLKTMGFPAGNTAELHFDNVRVPASHVLGGLGGAMRLLMHSLAFDRLQISARALGQAELAFDMTLQYAKDRRLFGQNLFDFQNTKFQLASLKTEIEVGRAFLHEMVRKVRSGTNTDTEAAMTKLWVCEMSGRVLDGCIQLFGGMGFSDEMPISRIYTSNRVLRIYGGTSETMKQSIARAL
ncbi:acyl-CoA dehydrogenase family protein [Arthrobacter sp. I2-34]|uniref:Acyl-CoA dehydrogenase family protein n=1 Tax=Arthrobacter hankyongi TaxID=2904801 RepID=A0ABS9L4B0_9MICC|nr:acyl-CoA dehydrogenase family protein [Arthrobacter hankyongi]MCG2621329.1 acyl-CoA dehydrogenase family protein [Arthrobacter hankyongi]